MRYVLFFVMALLGMNSTTIVMADGHGAEGRSGQEVFETNCANCHTGGFGGFFTGAPKVGDDDDWEALIPKGADGLTATTIAGIGEMEPRGACTVCTDDEIRAAVINETTACVGSVPLYQAAVDTVTRKNKAMVDMTVDEVFDGIIKHLDLLRPIYKATAAYGHFGRDGESFTWEATDKADDLRRAAGL